MTARECSPPHARRRALGAAVALLALTVTACSEVETPSGDDYAPATVTTADPSSTPTVRFTEEAASRVDLTMSTVAGREGALVVEYEALIYDKQGKTWVYTAPEPLTFLRAEVVVTEIDGNQVMLSDGPPPGTKVVTQGVTQVYGAELGMAGKH
jgi:redox-sensitive bicupin YhaK (pirin superfamily)